MSKQFLKNVALDHDLLFEFFVTFARFEFALKRGGFVKGDLRKAEPDWRKFGKSLNLSQVRLDPECAAAVDYFLVHPPGRQVMTSAGLAWDSVVGFSKVERMEQVLELVRRVRNNLFHGGKFNDHLHSPPGRNELFLRHSLVILHRCLELSVTVSGSYDLAAL